MNTRAPLTTILILAALMLPSSAGAAPGDVINYPRPVSGPHQLVLTGTEIIRPSRWAPHTDRTVYHESGVVLVQTVMSEHDGGEAGWHSVTVSKHPAWGSIVLPIGLQTPQRTALHCEPIGAGGSALLVRVPQRSCRAALRAARGPARGLSRGQRRGSGWACRTRGARAVCRLRGGRRFTAQRITRTQAAQIRSDRRQSLQRCGEATRGATVTVWARGVDCASAVDGARRVAERRTFHQSWGAGPTGWQCGGVPQGFRCSPPGECETGRVIVYALHVGALQTGRDHEGGLWRAPRC